MNFQQNLIRHGLISLATLLITLPFLGSTHLFDWDEINFAEAAREMIQSGNWAQVQISFTPFWEKPPFFFWLQAVSMKIFGVNEFAARFPNAIGAVIWTNLFYYIGNKHFSAKLGLAWILFYLGSFTPFFYFKSGIIDPWFNLFIFLSIYLIFRAIRTSVKKNNYFFISGIFLGLAIITKGPVALIVVGLTSTIFWVLNGMRRLTTFWNLCVMGFGILLIPLLWFLPETIKNGPWFLKTFLSYQADLLVNPVASHGQPWFYHPVVLLIGCFPGGVFAISKFSQIRGLTSEQVDLKRWLVIMFWVVLILFSMVTTKIVHYSSLCYISLSFLAAMHLHDWEKSANRHYGWYFQKSLLILISSIWSILLIVISLIANSSQLKSKLLPYIKDDFAKANLQIEGSWNGWEFLIGVVLLTGWLTYFISLRREKYIAKYTVVLLIFQIFFLFILTATLVPKVEKHTQGSAIEFYKNHADEDALILTYKFKSYAHYYYGKAKPASWTPEELKLQVELLKVLKAGSILDLSLREIESFEEKWKYTLMHHESNRKIYVVSQEKKAFEVEENPLFKKLYNKGGFVFFEKIK
jgi:4-amino-4-deoxy-L-arabinose transferase-like glycosyltransferase